MLSSKEKESWKKSNDSSSTLVLHTSYKTNKSRTDKVKREKRGKRFDSQFRWARDIIKKLKYYNAIDLPLNKVIKYRRQLEVLSLEDIYDEDAVFPYYKQIFGYEDYDTSNNFYDVDYCDNDTKLLICLPVEIWDYIFSFCQFRTKLNMILVCKDWYINFSNSLNMEVKNYMNETELGDSLPYPDTSFEELDKELDEIASEIKLLGINKNNILSKFVELKA